MLWGCLKSRHSLGRETSKEAKHSSRDGAEGSRAAGTTRASGEGGRNCRGSHTQGRWGACPLVSLIRNLLLQFKLLSAKMLGQKPYPLQRCLKAASSAHGQRALHRPTERGWGLGFDPRCFLLPQVEGEGGRKQSINFSATAEISTSCWCCTAPPLAPLIPPLTALTPAPAPNTRQEGGPAPSW